MHEIRSTVCDCGHDVGLHDGHGCAAYLGAFPATAHRQEYCRCRHASPKPLSLGERFDERRVLGTIRVRERLGSAIAVCEDPPALELGGSAVDVLARVKSRLRAAYPNGSGRRDLVLVVREQRDTTDIQVEPLN